MGTLHEDQHTFLVASHPFLPRMGRISDKSYRENQNTHIMFNNFFFLIMPFMRYCIKIL